MPQQSRAAILMGDTLFLSGTIAQDPATGKFTAGTMAEQAERTIQNLEILCRKAGMGLSNVVQATVQVSKLAFDAKIEISAVAMK